MQEKNNSFAIVSLTLGIICLILSILPFINILALIGGITAIVFGILALSKDQSKGMSITGLVLSVLAFFIIVIVDILALKAIFTEITSDNNLNKLSKIIDKANIQIEKDNINSSSVDDIFDEAQNIIDNAR